MDCDMDIDYRMSFPVEERKSKHKRVSIFEKYFHCIFLLRQFCLRILQITTKEFVAQQYNQNTNKMIQTNKPHN